ncbi:unnamed protein product [Darwinula stevensoni]|uniref:SGF29 C-terminal domain-containing protein n=1 Tax=Darwinula stevensoni TaxID=69355 RepID=A0A7R8X5G1_9CRUS|nr:unnamed protein product [Darwinula stevensoni]CAG0878617.1 unnamed protein product [Darwinula stevensoni]
MSAEKTKAVIQAVKQVQAERNRSEHVLTNINRTHERIKQDGKLTPYYKTKLRSLYSSALAEASNEVEALQRALDKIYEIRTIRAERCLASRLRRGALMMLLQNVAVTLPLYVGKKDEEPPPLCGAIPAESSYIAKPGEMVAALVKGEEGDDNWILAEVVGWNAALVKYEVDDIDEEQKERHVLSRRRVIPLPQMRADPVTCPEALHPTGSTVLAIYPQTTCFYKAIVKKSPSVATEDYEVLFEDPQYDDGYSPPLQVAQRYIISNNENNPYLLMKSYKCWFQFLEDKVKWKTIESSDGVHGSLVVFRHKTGLSMAESSSPAMGKKPDDMDVLPLSFIFVCMITFNNLCLKYVDVTFYYISRSLTTIFNVIFSFLILGEKTSKPVMGCCAVIIGGYYMGIDQEHGVGYLSLAGVSYGFLACIFVSLNAIFTKKILPAVDNSVWKLTFYNNVNGAIIFIPLMLLFQEQSVVFNFPNLSSFLFWFLMSITGVCGFAIAYVTILQIQVTSPLTHNISGTAKACAQTVIASVWYHELRPALWWLSNMIVLVSIMWLTTHWLLLSYLTQSEEQPSSWESLFQLTLAYRAVLLDLEVLDRLDRFRSDTGAHSETVLTFGVFEKFVQRGSWLYAACIQDVKCQASNVLSSAQLFTKLATQKQIMKMNAATIPLWENREDFAVRWTLISRADNKVYQIIGVLDGLVSPLIHMVILYETDAGFLRFGGLEWNPHWRDDLLASQIEELLPWLHDGSIHRFETRRMPLLGTSGGIVVPKDPLAVTRELWDSVYIPCNETRAQEFYHLHGPRDESREATLFRHKAWKILANAKTALDSIKVPFWISRYFRQCDIIPYSQDVDVGIFIANYKPEIRDVFLRNGFKLKHVFGLVNDSYELSFLYEGVKLDVFFFYESKDVMWNGGTQARTGLKFKYVFPRFSLCWTDFLELRLRVPCPTLPYVEANYGKDWFTPVVQWDWKSSPPNVQPNGVWPRHLWSLVIQVYPS